MSLGFPIRRPALHAISIPYANISFMSFLHQAGAAGLPNMRLVVTTYFITE
jgi:hypothetical protein